MKRIVGLLAWMLAGIIISCGCRETQAAGENPLSSPAQTSSKPAPAGSKLSSSLMGRKPAPSNTISLKDLPESMQEEIKRLASPDPQQRAAAVIALSKMKDKVTLVVPLLVGMLGDDSLSPTVAKDDPLMTHIVQVNVADTASRALIEIGAPAVKSLTDALKHSNARIRLGAVKILGKIKDRRALTPAIMPLLMTVKDSDWQVRNEAEASLNAIDSPARVDALLLVIQDKNVTLRIVATKILGKTNDPRVVEPLIQALKDQNPEVRRLAATGLGRTLDFRASQPLVAVMRDNNSEVQQAAAGALAQIRDPASVPALIEMLKDKNEQTRINSARILGRLRDARAREPLVALLHDPKAAVRQTAIEALVAVPEWRMTSVLVAMLDDPDPTMQVQRAAGNALTNRADLAAVPALIAMLKNGKSPKARSYAAQLLGMWQAQNALDALREAVSKDASYDVRVEAERAIKKISAIQRATSK